MMALSLAWDSGVEPWRGRGSTRAAGLSAWLEAQFGELGQGAREPLWTPRVVCGEEAALIHQRMGRAATAARPPRRRARGTGRGLGVGGGVVGLGSDGITGGDGFGDGFGPAGCDVHQCVMAMAVAAQLLGFGAADFEVDADGVAVHGVDPGGDGEAVAEAEGAFVGDVGGALVPGEADAEELLHGHAVAAGHLVEAGGEDVIEVTAAVDVLEHVDVVGAHLHFGGEACFPEGTPGGIGEGGGRFGGFLVHGLLGGEGRAGWAGVRVRGGDSGS